MSVTLWVDSFIFDQVTRWADFYNYGSSAYPTLWWIDSWSYVWNNIGATLSNLSRTSTLYTSEQWSYLCWWVSAIYVQNNNGYAITTSVRCTWSITFWWSGNSHSLVWTWGSATINPWYWKVWWFTWPSVIKNDEPYTSVNFNVNYFLPGSATEYSEDNFWPTSPIWSSNSASASCPAFLSQWPWMVWIEWNSFCFSDSRWFKKVAQSSLIASWVSAQPWLWWIDNTVWSTSIPPAANWYEYWINYTWADGNVYRTTSQINKDSLWAWNLHKQWLMWMENWNDAWTLGFIWPNAQKMLLWGWTSAPTNVKF